MKRKIFSVLFALVLVCTMALVMAVPVSAGAITSIAVTPEDNSAGAETDYSIAFTPATGQATDVIIDFSAFGTTGDDMALATVSTTIGDYAFGGFFLDPTGVTVNDTTKIITFSGGTVTPGADCTISNAVAETGFVITNDKTAGTEDVTISTDADSGTYALTIVPGAAASFTVEDIESPIALGTSSDVTVTAKDGVGGAGNVAIGYTGTIAFTSSDTDAVLPDDYTFTAEDAGTKTFTDGVTFFPAALGSKTVTATDTVDSDIAGTSTGITVAEPTEVWVDDDWAEKSAGDVVATGKVFSRNAFAIIQNGVNAAAATGTVTVEDGTYTPQATLSYYAIVVDKELILQAATGSTPVIDAQRATPGTAYYPITIQANDVTIDGFTIVNDGTDIEKDYGIYVPSAYENFVIQNNTITGFSGAPNSIGIKTMNCVLNANTSGLIKGNTLEDNRDAIQVQTSQYVTIEGNLVQNNRNGIALYASTNITAIENKVYSSTNIGLYVDGSSIGTFQLNDIVGNTTGFQCDNAGKDADAQYNWWGDASGPSAGAVAPSTALGSGDVVSLKVDYDPWLTETYAVAIVNNVCYYGSTMPLEAGWNTLSVPLALKDTADTLTEIGELGDYLISTGANQNWEIAYQYNPATPGWETPTELVPGRGYYIKTLEAVSFPVLYSGALSLPTLKLDTAGWNLIGSAFGIDKDATPAQQTGDYGICPYYTVDDSLSPDAWKTVADALTSVSGNASVVVSPAVPGQEVAWGTTATDGTTKMIVGEGYWVYMEATDTLVGFEVTPMHFSSP